jgi:hypothetical protein
MFHFRLKPSPPAQVGRDTPGQAVDSSAIVSVPGKSWWTWMLNVRSRSIASRFSRPPNRFGSPTPTMRR